MEDFKIELYEEETKQKFPWFQKLTNEQCTTLRRKLFEAVGCENNSNDIKNLEFIDTIQRNIPEFNAEENFNLTGLFQFLELVTTEKVFINWYRFDDIDEFYTKDVATYFEDIWFPSADDIDIFDNTFSWIVSIRHDGNVKFWSKK